MTTYTIKSIFGPTIQGEGAMTGRVCHFVRFAGCNRWDGRIETRSSSDCPYCDTDFFKGEKLTSQDVIARLRKLDPHVKWVTITGGEPMLQIARRPQIVFDLVAAGYYLALETNGSIAFPGGVQDMFAHVTVSPKQPNADTVVRICDTLKVLFPHPDPRIWPSNYADMIAKTRYVQPIEPMLVTLPLVSPDHAQRLHDEQWSENVKASIAYCLANPDWLLGAQVHKYIEVA